MSLILVRQSFAAMSGRHDLVTDFAAGTYTDNGANVFLNYGQKMLDRRSGEALPLRWYRKDMLAGEYSLSTTLCRSIQQVWAMAAGYDRFELTKKKQSWLRNEYPEAYSTLSSGTPAYYCPKDSGLAPAQATLTSGTYTTQFTNDFEDLEFANSTTYTGILVMPPVDMTYTISILARFYSPTLANDSDATFWTERHPDLLTLAGMWALEGMVYRNFSGQREIMAQIDEALNDIDKDVAEEQAANVYFLEG